MSYVAVAAGVALVTALGVSVALSRSTSPSLRPGYVTVSPDGPDAYGQFGPHTPGTTTAGLQEAFDQTGVDIQVLAGRYVMPPDFAGIEAFRGPRNFYQTITGSSQAEIIVPNSYPGVALTLAEDSGGESNNFLDGFIIEEAGTPQQKWTGVRRQSLAVGNSWCSLSNVFVYQPNVGYEEYIGGPDPETQYITGNINTNLLVNAPLTAGFKWTTAYSANHAFAGNNYYGCQVEMGLSGPTAVGFDNIDGEWLNFDGCIAWDASGSQHQSIIASTAANIDISKSPLMQLPPYFINNGTATVLYPGTL